MQTPRLIRVLLSTLAVSVIDPCFADEVEKGRELATRLCAVCHMNEGQGEKQGAAGIPGFVAIANRPNQTYDDVVHWLGSRPPMMPDHHLTRNESGALAAFIMSLRTAR